MRMGFALGNIGPIGTAENLVRIARHGETLGYDGLWTIERLLWPLNPRTPYPITADGRLSEEYKHLLDPVDALMFAAAHTSRIGLGTSVINIPYYNPVTLARRLTTLDYLSGGRLRVGFGLGWSADEFEAAGAEFKERGARADEFLQVLKAIWTSDPVEFEGRYFRVPRSIIGPKPVQKPHPPIYLGAYVPAALQRVATRADGWNPVGIPLAEVERMFGQVREMARAAGRDPAALELVVRANLEITAEPIAGERPDFHGSIAQIREDIKSCRAMGVHELILDPTFASGAQELSRWLEIMEIFAERVSRASPRR